jgi:hypothetical protein
MFKHPYICLDSSHPLDDVALKSWIQSVTNASPQGIISSTETQPGNHQISFYMRKTQNVNHYIGVLARNLSGEEATNIARAYDLAAPDGDFTIHWSQEPVQDLVARPVESDLLAAIILEAVKRNHNNWYRSKTDRGWRYGVEYNQLEKVSPFCKDWDSLPHSYQLSELTRMESLMEILHSMDLKITR